MNFTLCVLLVYNDNRSVQTLCITRVSVFCTKCLHRPIVINYKPTIHKGWNSFYIFTLFSCVWILFNQSLSWKWLCFSWKSDGMHGKWKSIENISVWQQSFHHRYKEKSKFQSFIIFDNESCVHTHLQHLSWKERRATMRNVTGNADDVSD